MIIDTFFNTNFDQFVPNFKEQEDMENDRKNLKLIKCHACKKGLVHLNSNLFKCPICKGHGKLIINITNGYQYYLGEISDFYKSGEIKNV